MPLVTQIVMADEKLAAERNWHGCS
jgi:hypothetical protein